MSRFTNSVTNPSAPAPRAAARTAKTARSPGAQTLALHGPGALPGSPRRTGEIVRGVSQTTSFHQSQVGGPAVPGAHAYSRVSNPSVDELEVALGVLEDALPAVAFGTGLGAETALFLALLKAGDHLVVGDAIYGGTTRLVRQILSDLGITATFVDPTDVRAVEAAITPRTKLVFIETPSNPTLRLTDITAIAAVVRRANQGWDEARRVRLAVDNTFLTPIAQQPLDLGADISVYSTTKLIEGHSTACGGAIVSREADVLDKVRWVRKCTGGIQAPLNAWLTTRGIKSLPLRLERHCHNAQRIAEWLAQHPAVTVVHYPGLRSHPQADLAARQHARGLHGGVISFEVEGGVEAGRRVLEGTHLCCLAEHVGSIESILTHPATMTHADVPPEQRRATGITDGLIRLSVGLEEPEDVIADLEQAIARAVIVRDTECSPAVASCAPAAGKAGVA